MTVQGTTHPPAFVEGALKVATEGEHEERKIAIEAFNSFGSTALKGVFILNGGAIIALLALMGALAGKDAVKPLLDVKMLIKALIPSLEAFGLGVALAAFASGLGYLNWSARVMQHWEPWDWNHYIRTGERPARSKWIRPTIEAFRAAAILAYFISLGCFGRGAWMVANAFRKVTL